MGVLKELLHMYVLSVREKHSEGGLTHNVKNLA